MWCFISSPRRVLASVLVAFCLCLCCMTLFAYWDGPRLDTASVDNDLMDLFVGDFDVSFGLGQTHINAKWDCPDKNGKQRYDAETLCDRLRAANFLKDFRAVAIARNSRLSELFNINDDGRLVCRCHRNRPPYSRRDILFVRAIYSKRFCARSPAYEWSRWLQERLPFMPDRAAIEKEADKFNKDAVDALDAQVRLAFPHLESPRQAILPPDAPP